MSNNNSELQLITREGEGQTIEFKEKPTGLDKEMVAFANAMGGSIFIGVSDDNTIRGFSCSNKDLSQIQDIARNCDPPVHIQLKRHGSVLEVVVREGMDKPYRCSGGFYLRVGPNSQKLTRDEIISFAVGEGKVRFDEHFNSHFKFTEDFSIEEYMEFARLAGVPVSYSAEDVLISVNAVKKQKSELLFTNAAVLFFAKDPQKFFPEAYITCVRYQGLDRVSIMDKKDMRTPLLAQLKESVDFFKRHTSQAIVVSGKFQHNEIAEYPVNAVREALVNAAMHRDYLYDSSHIYMHIFDDRIEISNPGGLFKGLTVDDLGKKSVRRNRLIAELFYRAGYIEMVGTGMNRMFNAMKEDGNPAPEINASNFFEITLKKRVLPSDTIDMTDRQKRLLHFINTKVSVTKEDCAKFLGVSGDSALRDIQELKANKLVVQVGIGKATRYSHTSK